MVFRPVLPGLWLYFITTGLFLVISAALTSPAAAVPTFDVTVDKEAPAAARMASFSYRIVGSKPRITASIKDGFLFCANVGFSLDDQEVGNVEFRVDNRTWRFGDVSTSLQPIYPHDIRWFRYNVTNGRPNLFLSSVTRGSSWQGSLVCLEADAHGKRTKRWNSLFKDGFEPEPSLFSGGFEWHIDHGEPDIPVFNSSVRVEMGGIKKMGVEWYALYKIVARLPPLSTPTAYIVRDGFDKDVFGEGATTWCTPYSDPGGHLSGVCSWADHLTDTVDYRFTAPVSGIAREYYVVVERLIKNGSFMPRKPVVAAALFPDPAAQEQYRKDNVDFGYGH